MKAAGPASEQLPAMSGSAWQHNASILTVETDDCSLPLLKFSKISVCLIQAQMSYGDPTPSFDRLFECLQLSGQNFQVLQPTLLLTFLAARIFTQGGFLLFSYESGKRFAKIDPFTHRLWRLLKGGEQQKIASGA